MMGIYAYHSALRGGLGPAGGVFPPALLVNRHGYWLVARTQIRSPSATQFARVPMDNLGLKYFINQALKYPVLRQRRMDV
jgi:hypothetical protein